MRTRRTPAAGRATPPGSRSGSRTAVLGSPVGDSLAPALHRAAYAALGLDWTCEAIECGAPGLPALVDPLDGDRTGLCLALALRRAVLPLVDEVSDLALDVGGADTVVFRDGRSLGDHTGAHGITAALRQAGLRTPGSAVVLGGGAAACSALAALRELGVREPAVVVREPGRAAEVEAAAGRLGVSVDLHGFDALDRLLREVAVVVSTLPADAADALAPTVARSGATVLDTAYAARPTRLVKAAGFAGCAVVDGLSVLTHRTMRQIELMTGLPGPTDPGAPTDPPAVAVRRAARAELVRRAAREAEPAG